jgi:hypothetical protein
MPLPLDAQRLAHQGSLGWRRQMVEVADSLRRRRLD